MCVVYVYMFVCSYVRMFVRLYVCMFVCLYIRIFVCCVSFVCRVCAWAVYSSSFI